MSSTAGCKPCYTVTLRFSFSVFYGLSGYYIRKNVKELIMGHLYSSFTQNSICSVLKNLNLIDLNDLISGLL